jgi:hypothetical protein
VRHNEFVNDQVIRCELDWEPHGAFGVEVDFIPTPLNVPGSAVCGIDLPVDCRFFPALHRTLIKFANTRDDNFLYSGTVASSG